MISAWARMCKILGKDFQQYLPVVMGPLMKTASIKPEVALLDSELQPRPASSALIFAWKKIDGADLFAVLSEIN